MTIEMLDEKREERLNDMLIELEQIQSHEQILSIKKEKLMADISMYYVLERGREKTFNNEDFKVKVKKPVNYSLDLSVWESIRRKIAPELRPVKSKVELDVRAYKGLQIANKEVFEIVSDAVSFKDGKINVKVERVVR